MKKLVTALQSSYPDITFNEGTIFRWTPSTRSITYTDRGKEHNTWSLLHELGHAILNHQAYSSDIELLQKEVAAWRQAIALAANFDITIDTEHIENCLDSYRDWIHKRSTCPECSLQGIQRSSEQYFCLNCRHTWKVTSARFCRPYRRSK